MMSKEMKEVLDERQSLSETRLKELIEELQERIPVQIQVVQEGHNSSSKVIVTSSNC